MAKLYDWMSGLEALKPKDRAKEFFSITRSIGAPMAFDQDDLIDLLDWQVFMKVILDTYVVLDKDWLSEKNLGCISGLLNDPKPGSLFSDFMLTGVSQNRHVVALASKIAEIADEISSPSLKFKLSNPDIFAAIPLSFWDGMRQQKLHWQVFETVHTEPFIEYALDLICTHNAKDFHSSASSVSNILCDEVPDAQANPYIGFTKSARTVYVGCNNGADSFYQGIASMSVASEGRVITFAECFNLDSMRDAMLNAGASMQWLERMRTVTEAIFNRNFPQQIDGLMKQVYWKTPEGPYLLLTPMIASSIQADLHDFLTGHTQNPEQPVKTANAYLRVQRIGSNASNGGRLAATLNGRHNLIKSFPKKRAPGVYANFYEVVYGDRLNTYIAADRLEKLSVLVTSQFSNDRMREATDAHADSIATDLAAPLLTIMAFVRENPMSWVEKKRLADKHLKWVKESFIKTLSQDSITFLSDLILTSNSSVHMNDAVRDTLRLKLKNKLEQTI